MIWSIAGWMKSRNWISAIGIRPFIAIPIALPAITDSASGASITRSSPNSSSNPTVTRNTPPRRPMSSPSTTIRSSARISSASDSLIASSSVLVVEAGRRSGGEAEGVSRRASTAVPPREFSCSAIVEPSITAVLPTGHGGSRTAPTVRLSVSIHVVVEGHRVGERQSFRGIGRGVDFGADFGVELVKFLFGQRADLAAAAGEERNRVVAAPRLHLVRAAVDAVVVVGGMGVEAVDLCFHQRRAVAAPGAVGRLFDGLVDREQIGAVDNDAGKTVTGRAVGHVVDRHLQILRHRDGVAVVLAEENDRQLVDTGEVARLVEIALGAATLAEADSGDLSGLAQLGRVG